MSRPLTNNASHVSPVADAISRLTGYRLHKLEVYNWGTFDGKVYSVRPNGQTTLLVGQNGSGKSTLVDALVTLLVRPGTRSFNVAAGGGKRERDERSYLKGAYDRSDSDGYDIQVKYLRPKGDQFSVLLACFRNVAVGKTMTLAQLLYLGADQTVQKIYCLAPDERSIQEDFANLNSTDAVVRALEARGFRATRKFAEFEGWFQKATGVKTKAMDVFNQTVAVKDVHRLNDFIRDHMLEPHDWGERVERLLSHFTQLSEAHRSLVKVRQQSELLEPVVRVGHAYREQARELEHVERLIRATDAFFARKAIDLFTPETQRRREELGRIRCRRALLGDEIKSAREQCRSIQNEIDHAGGTRLHLLPLLIEKEQSHATQKRQQHAALHDAMRRAGIEETARDEAALTEIQRRIPALQSELESASAQRLADRESVVLNRGAIRERIRESSDELAGLSRRRENLPEWCAAVRQSLCSALKLDARDLPFAAELIAVHPDEREWEASIEKVLRGFALSLLVPERLYHVVTGHLERTQLVDARGWGRRLVYLRVAEEPSGSGTVPGPQSLLRKLVFREKHVLVPWVRGELAQRVDYRCCQTIEEFWESRGLAMTRSRHVKSGPKRHEKDDRAEAADPRNFVLGWDNSEKKERIAGCIERLKAEDAADCDRIERLDRQIAELHQRRAALASAAGFSSFAEIDYGRHEREATALEREKRAIENGSDTIRLLKRRLAEVDSKIESLQNEEKDAIRQEALFERMIADGERLTAKARAELDEREADRSLAPDRECFAELESFFASQPLAVERLFDQQRQLERSLRGQADRLRPALRPVEEELLRSMNRFLRDFPEERADLDAGIAYLGGYLALRQRIVEEDLPRHERRFKERLNEKVIHELALFNGALEQERRGIQDKIETLNVSLKRLEYRPGTHIQLEPRPVRDREIIEFQSKLRECIEGALGETPEANDARFARIHTLLGQLADENNARWREKVVDVRRWFDFVASVIDRRSLEQVSVYQDSSGQSGGEKAKLAFTILVAAIAYQYDLDPEHPAPDRFHFVVVDEMFSKVDDQHAEYALELFKQFGLQLLIVAPLDAKARVTQPYVGCYLHVDKRDNRSEIFEMTAREFEESVHVSGNGRAARRRSTRP